MALGVISKEHLGKLIAAVSRTGRFLGPVDKGDGVCLTQVSAGDMLALDYVNFILPPKRMFFPRSEVIATHGSDGMTATPLPEGRVVLFGIRPCDVLSLVYLDKVFLDEKYADPYYRSRRDNAVIISLACRQPAPTCFCTSIKGSPAGKAGADILAVDIGDVLLLESVTATGEAFMAEYGKLLDKPSAEQVSSRQAQVAAADAKMARVSIDQATAKLRARFDAAAWDELTARCLGCGVCTFLCPTCHCFRLYDEQVGGQNRRVRAQDACAFPAFTLEASGHNPRTRQGMRMRHRMMHKFCYTAESFGEIFCVGCGRCIRSCPANLDIRETLTEVSK